VRNGSSANTSNIIINININTIDINASLHSITSRSEW
jgi:hypothetical protein